MYEESLPSSGPPAFKMEIYMQSDTRFNSHCICDFCNTLKANFCFTVIHKHFANLDFLQAEGQV